MALSRRSRLSRLVLAALTTTAFSTVAHAAGEVRDAGEVAPGMYWDLAKGVSANGAFVTGQGFNGTNNRSFLMSAVGVIELGIDDAFATDVSNGGVVVGNVGGGTSAFRWSQADGFQDLGRIDMEGGGVSFANAVSSDGSRVAGHSYVP